MRSIARLSPIVAALFLLGSAGARAELRHGVSVVVVASEVIPENLTVSADEVAVHGHVTGDLVVVARSLVVDGDVDGDVLAAATDVTIAGVVGGDVRAGAVTLAVHGSVGGDVIAGAGRIDLAAAVAGDALLACTTCRVTGSIARSLRAAAGYLVVDGLVARDLDVAGGALLLGPDARAHDLRFAGNEPVRVAHRASISGHFVETTLPVPATRTGALWFAWLQLLLGSFFLGAIWLRFFRRAADAAVDALRTHPGRTAALGVAGAIVAPLALLVVFALGAVVGGWWLAIFGLAFAALAVALSFPLVATTLGLAIARRLKLPEEPRWIWMGAALVPLFLALHVKVLGVAVAVLVVIHGCGASIASFRRTHTHAHARGVAAGAAKGGGPDRTSTSAANNS